MMTVISTTYNGEPVNSLKELAALRKRLGAAYDLDLLCVETTDPVTEEDWEEVRLINEVGDKLEKILGRK